MYAIRSYYVVFTQHRNRHRDGGEIVDDLQPGQAQVGLHLADGKCPTVIGHADPVSLNGRNNFV